MRQNDSIRFVFDLLFFHRIFLGKFNKNVFIWFNTWTNTYVLNVFSLEDTIYVRFGHTSVCYCETHVCVCDCMSQEGTWFSVARAMRCCSGGLMISLCLSMLCSVPVRSQNEIAKHSNCTENSNAACLCVYTWDL